MSTAQIAAVERHVLRAWPAAEIEELDGWRLRFAEGVTGRANSVWPPHESFLSIPARLA